VSSEDLPFVIAAAIATGVWLLALGAVRAYRQPREPEDLEPTLDLGPEPPALAGFLAGNFRVRRDAVPATLLDLCSRGHAELERVDVDSYQCQLEDMSADGLAPYEERVLRHLRDSARDRIVPTRALTTGPGDQSKRWWKSFRNEVVDDAQRRGLSRDIWSRDIGTAFGVAAAVPAVIVAVGFGLQPAFVYAILPGAVLTRVMYGRRQRDTPAGLEAAARWRAVQVKLAENPVFAEQPPIAVAMWERLLAYGAALGVAPAAIRPISMGAEPENRAWSTYGGRWHQIDVRYLHGPHWGVHPGWAALQRLLPVVFGALFLWLAGPIVTDGLDEVDGLAEFWLLVALVVPVVVVAGGTLFALRAAADLFSTKDVTGEIVRLRTKKAGDDETEHYVAVDDGSSREVRAWLVRPELYSGLEQGQVVTAQVTPRLAYVRSISPAPT
jgi:predicted membrane protein DUF2207